MITSIGIKWLVVWTVVNFWPIPCDFGPTSGYDEYGRRWTSNGQPSILCLDSETIKKEKYFDTYEEAEEFVEAGKAKPLSPFSLDPQLTDWEIKKITTEPIEKDEEDNE